jgi:hypothetical protein
VNWNFYGDKFPGVAGDDMDLMFQVLVQQNRSKGRIVWGYFRDSDTVESDLLADNLAGALNAAVRIGREPVVSPRTSGSGCFYWERWMPDDISQ